MAEFRSTVAFRRQAPLLMAFLAAVLSQYCPQHCCCHGALAFANMGHGIAHEVDPAALPGGMEDPGYRSFQTFVGVGNDQFQPRKPR